MILHQFNAKKIRRFLTFFQYFHFYFIGNQLFLQVMTSVNMPSFSPNSILIPQKKKYKNPTKINGSAEISLLVGDRQAQNLNRILDISVYLPAHRAPL